MQRESTGPADRRRRSRRMRLVPPAVTPLRASDIGAGLLGQFRNEGRDQFRRAIETSLDAEGSGTYTSFRRALAACLQELARQEDDRETVLVPAFCSSDFVDAIEGVGLEAVRYDIDPETLAADEDSVAAELRSDPLALVAVNVLGYGSPIAELAEQCGAHNTFLVEALGYALGTKYDQERLGTFGDCAVLNFQQGKPIPVGGGMVVNQNPALSFGDADRPAVDVNVGALAGYTVFSRPRAYYVYTRLRTLLDAAGLSAPATTHPEQKFDVAYGGQFATLSNFQGTVAHRVFDRLDEHRRQRQRTARFYADELSDVAAVRHLSPVDGLAPLQYVRYPIRLESESLRDRIKASLVDAGIQATTLYDWPILDPATFPGAAALQRAILTLPTHPYVDEQDRQQIVAIIRAEVAAHQKSS
ncbi:MAG: DegT/DnrJ/EryC1/StrS family aminotransferase [Halobacteriota archaeon]